MKNFNPLKESNQIMGPVKYGTNHQPGLNTNPAGLSGIRVNKNRKFANTPKEYVALIKECIQSMLIEKGFDKQKQKLILLFADKLVNDKNYLTYINLPAPAIYQKIENEILVRL